jgi:hypothetical protein
MIIFLRKIPIDTRPSELHNYINPALKGGLLSRSGRVLKAEILVIQDKATKALECHGLVHVDAEAAGQRAIKKLKGERFKGRPVIVREYIQRYWHNDRRHNSKHVADENMEKRVHNRRRGNTVEMVDDVSNIFCFADNESRKLISAAR